MRCKKCRKTIPDGSKFCNHCGTPQEKKKFYRRPDGLYEKSITINGKRKVFRGRDEKEIERKMLEYNQETEKHKNGLPFKVVANDWERETYETIAYNTERGYRPRAARAIEHFDDMPITQIKIQDINRYINLFPKTWAFKTVNAYFSVLSLIFNYACRCGYIEHNPCEYVKLPKGLKKGHRRAPTETEIDIIKSSTNVDGGLIAYFFLFSGLRRGEALALTWNDIDFEKKIISVTKSVYWVSNSPHIKPPKTEKGNREVVLLDCLADLLKPIKGKNEDLVFGDEGKLYTNKRFAALWKRYQNATGLNEVTPHVARHGFASMCFDAQIDIKDVQDLMGHAQYSTTSDIYTHISETHKENTLKKLNEYTTNAKITHNAD